MPRPQSRVGVVHPEVTQPSVLLGDPEVDVHRLGVTDMKVPVRLWGKARAHTAAVSTSLLVFGNDLTNEVESTRYFCLSVAHF